VADLNLGLLLSIPCRFLWTAHLGRARSRQLLQILADLREITDPYAEPRMHRPGADGRERQTGVMDAV
jgi:hypothetical protein